MFFCVCPGTVLRVSHSFSLILLASFYSGGKQGTERLSDLAQGHLAS